MRYLYAFAIVLCLSSCSTCREQAMDKLSSLKDTLDAEMQRANERAARKDRLQIMIDSIKTRNFTYNYDSLNAAVLVHNNWAKGFDRNENGLMVVIYEESDGIAMMSTLPGIHSPLHNRVEIEIAGTSYVADSNYTYPLTVPDGAGYTAVHNAKGEVLYILEEDAMDLIEAIAANSAEEIKITASFNDEVYASYTLPEDDKQAIIESYQLLLLIKELHELEAQDVHYDD